MTSLTTDRYPREWYDIMQAQQFSGVPFCLNEFNLFIKAEQQRAVFIHSIQQIGIVPQIRKKSLRLRTNITACRQSNFSIRQGYGQTKWSSSRDFNIVARHCGATWWRQSKYFFFFTFDGFGLSTKTANNQNAAEQRNLYSILPSLNKFMKFNIPSSKDGGTYCIARRASTWQCFTLKTGYDSMGCRKAGYFLILLLSSRLSGTVSDAGCFQREAHFKGTSNVCEWQRTSSNQQINCTLSIHSWQ